MPTTLSGHPPATGRRTSARPRHGARPTNNPAVMAGPLPACGKSRNSTSGDFARTARNRRGPAGVRPHPAHVRLLGKADMIGGRKECLLETQSGL